MTKKTASLAKLSRPNAIGLLPRERLFVQLDDACRQPCVWVLGLAGAGKTSLLASYLDRRPLRHLWYQLDAGDADLATFFHYLGRAARTLAPRKRPLPSLTPEYLLGLETFTRRFFRVLFERLTPPFVLVLDNYQDVPVEAPVHPVLAIALSEVPPGSTLVLVSRQEPPAPLARAYAGAAVIGWEALKLTAEETAVFAHRHGCTDPDLLSPVIATAQGWAAGIVLLLRNQAESGTALPAESSSPQALLITSPTSSLPGYPSWIRPSCYKRPCCRISRRRRHGSSPG